MNEIQTADYYLLRLPALPYDRIVDLDDSFSGCDAETKLRRLCAVRDFQDAIFLASEDLYNEMLKWLSDGNKIAPEKLLISLYKYTIRMGVRATPYGMFAGISAGQIDKIRSSFVFAGGQQKMNRLDMSVSTEIASFLAHTSALKGNILFSVNTTLYLVKGVYRYYKYNLNKGRREYSLAGLKRSKTIQVVIDHCKNGKSYNDLMGLLLLSNISKLNAGPFLDRLIENQVIVSELQQTLTGTEYFQMIRKVLRDTDPDGNYSNILLKIDLLLQNEDSIAGKSYKIKEIINQQLFNINTKNLLQTDLLYLTTENRVKSSVFAKIATDIKDLAPLNRAKIPSSLSHFTARFKEIYGERTIPLLEALDNDFGIGYGNGEAQYGRDDVLIGQLALISKNTSEETKWSGFQQLALQLLLKSKEGGLYEVRVELEDLKQLKISAGAGHSGYPAAFYAIGNLVAENIENLDAGKFKFNLISCNGPSAVPLMARFGNLDAELAVKLQQSAYIEQQCYPDAILAEIIHLPESRTGNILQRPQLRKYEIPFLSQSATGQDYQILLSDLFIHVKDNKIVLQSKKHKKVVMPRLSTAHNYANGLAVYRFLADLQYQDDPFSIHWDWEQFSGEEFLPRVSYQNIILSRARWTLKDGAYRELNAAKSPDDITAFRERYRLPDKVMLTEGDNEFLIDFYSILARKVLLKKLRKNFVVVHEFLFSDRNSPFKNDLNEVFTNEIIIPFYSEKQLKNTYLESEDLHPTRLFPPGSEWTYVKIYCSRRQTDKVLTDAVSKIVECLMTEKLISKWFFIRYQDSGNHIRLRFLNKGSAAGLTHTVVSQIYNELRELFASGIVRNIQYDTYDRELERYGAGNIEISESIFYHDSIFVLAMLKRLNGHLEYRWLVAAFGVDQLLGAAGLDLQGKLEIVEGWRDNFLEEFSKSEDLNYQLNNTYRTNKTDLFLFMSGKHTLHQDPVFCEILASRRPAMQNLLQKIRSKNLEIKEKQADFYLKLLPSFSHMFINRLFFADQKFYELAIYHCLHKYYRTMVVITPSPAIKDQL